MDIEGIETFLAIVDKHTLNQASILLNLTQSSVSKRLRLLEDDLGYKLIFRGKGVKNTELTEKGIEFIPIAEQWMRLWRETQMIKSRHNSCYLAIGSVDSVSNYVLSPVYNALLRYSPPVDFTIRIQRSIELYKLIENRELDIGFAIIKMTNPCVIVEPFYTEPMVLLRLAQENIHEEDIIHPSSLDPAHEVFYYDGTAYQIWHDKWWERTHRPRASVHTCSAVASLLHEKRQWTIVPLSFAASLKKTGIYIYNHLEDPFVRTCYKLTHKHPRRSAEQGLFVLDGLCKNIKPC